MVVGSPVSSVFCRVPPWSSANRLYIADVASRRQFVFSTRRRFICNLWCRRFICNVPSTRRQSQLAAVAPSSSACGLPIRPALASALTSPVLHSIVPCPSGLLPALHLSLRCSVQLSCDRRVYCLRPAATADRYCLIDSYSAAGSSS